VETRQARGLRRERAFFSSSILMPAVFAKPRGRLPLAAPAFGFWRWFQRVMSIGLRGYFGNSNL